jgi:hypothetical protein
MAKLNHLAPKKVVAATHQPGSNNIFNLKSFNDLKKNQTKIKIIKNSFFDSNFNSVQNLYTNLSHSSASLALGAKAPKARRALSGDTSNLLPKTDFALSRSALAGGAVLERSTKKRAIKKAPLAIYPQSPSLNSYSKIVPLLTQPGGQNKKSARVATPTGDLPLVGCAKRGAIKGVTKREMVGVLPQGTCHPKGRTLSQAHPPLPVAPPLREAGSYSKISAILRAIRSIRLNRVPPLGCGSKAEWKLIYYINLMEKKIRAPFFACPSLPYGSSSLKGSEKGCCERVLPKAHRKKIKKKLFKQKSPLQEATPLREALYKEGAVQEHIKKIFTYNNIINKNILLRNMKYSFLKSVLSSILKKRIRRMSEILEDKPIKNYVIYSYLKNCIFTPATASLATLADGKGGALAGGTGCVSKGRTKLSLNKYKGRKFGSFINYNKIIGFNFNSTALPRLWQAVHPPLAAESPSDCNRYIKNIYKLLFYLFKSMYCLISKPVLRYTNDKVTIQLFYYLNIPKKKIFRLFSISYIKSIKKKWLAQSTPTRVVAATQQPGTNPMAQLHFSRWPKAGGVLPLGRPALPVAHSYGGRGKKHNVKALNIRWKLRKAISRLKNKFNTGFLPPLRELLPAEGGTPTTLLSASTGGEGKTFFFLRKFNLTKVYQKKFKLICVILSKIFNKPVELQLIRLHHPYHDSNILVNLLSLNIKNKKKKARVAIQKIYNKKPVKFLNGGVQPATGTANLKKTALLTADSFATQGSGKIIPAFLSGLNIKINGRLMGEPIIPRITTKNFSKGASATGKVNFLDVARITKKNRKGAYTIKITSGQNFF